MGRKHFRRRHIHSHRDNHRRHSQRQSAAASLDKRELKKREKGKEDAKKSRDTKTQQQTKNRNLTTKKPASAPASSSKCSPDDWWTISLLAWVLHPGTLALISALVLILILIIIFFATPLKHKLVKPERKGVIKFFAGFKRKKGRSWNNRNVNRLSMERSSSRDRSSSGSSADSTLSNVNENQACERRQKRERIRELFSRKMSALWHQKLGRSYAYVTNSDDEQSNSSSDRVAVSD